MTLGKDKTKSPMTVPCSDLPPGCFQLTTDPGKSDNRILGVA